MHVRTCQNWQLRTWPFALIRLSCNLLDQSVHNSNSHHSSIINIKKNGFWFLIPDYMTLNHWVIESYENENENVKNRSRIQIQKNKQLSPVGLESGVWQQPSPPLRACVFSEISALLSARISQLCWMTLPNAWTMLSSHQRPKSLNLRKWERKRIISIQNTE